MPIYDAYLTIIVIATTAVLFLIVFGVVLVVVGPAQYNDNDSWKDNENLYESDNLSADELQFDFDTVAPATIQTHPQSAPQKRTFTASSYRSEKFVIDKLNCGGECRLCGSDAGRLFKFTLMEFGNSESANLCEKCCKKLIKKLKTVEISGTS